MQVPPLDPIVLALLRTKQAQGALRQPQPAETPVASPPSWMAAQAQPTQPAPSPASEYSIVQGEPTGQAVSSNPLRSASDVLREQSNFLRTRAEGQQAEASEKRKRAEETRQKAEEARREAQSREAPAGRQGFGTQDTLKMLLLALFAGLSGGEEAGAFVTSMVRSYMDQVKAYNEANWSKFEKDKQAAFDEADRLEKESARLAELADLLEGRSDKTLFQWLDTQEKAATTAVQEQKNAQLEKKQEQTQRAQLDQYNLSFLKSIYDPNQTEAEFQDKVQRYNDWVNETNQALGEVRYQPIDPERSASIWQQAQEKRQKEEQLKLGDLYVREGARQLSSGTPENRQVGAQMFLQGVFLQSSAMPDGPEKERFLANVQDSVKAAASSLPPQSVLALVKARILQRSENDIVRREYWRTEAVIEQVRKSRSGGGKQGGGKPDKPQGNASDSRTLGNLILQYKRLTDMESAGGIFGPGLSAEDRAMVSAMKEAVRRQAAEHGIDLEKPTGAQQKQPPAQSQQQKRPSGGGRATRTKVPTINGKPAFVPDNSKGATPPKQTSGASRNAPTQRQASGNPFDLLPPVNTNW